MKEIEFVFCRLWSIGLLITILLPDDLPALLHCGVEWIPHPGCWALGKAVSVCSPLPPAWPHTSELEAGMSSHREIKRSHSPCWAYGLGKECLSLFLAWCALLCSA